MPAISPWLIAAAVASAAASAGGTAASMAGQASIRKKQAAQRNAERARTLATDKQREATIAAAVPKYDRPSQETQQAGLADQLEQYLAAPPPPVNEYVAQNPGAPTEVTDSMARQLAGALATGKGYAKDLAKVSSFGRLGLDNKLAMNRLAEQVGMLNNQQARSTGILGTELEGAYGAGVGANNMAGLLSGVSDIANAGVGYGIMSRIGAPGPRAFRASPSRWRKHRRFPC